jgi:hypothetical protein
VKLCTRKRKILPGTAVSQGLQAWFSFERLREKVLFIRGSYAVMPTNSKICREQNIFGVVHSKSGKDRRNFGQKPKNSPGNSRFTRFTGMAFL